MIANQKIARFVSVLDRISQLGFNIPGLIMSSPGYGKTSTLEMLAKYKDYNLTTLIASQYAPDDILGLQAVNSGKLERLTPSWFNDMIDLSKNGKRNILFIDEITTCDEFIQAPLMNLIFTRKLNNRVALPENTVIIAAGNYAEELNNSFKLSLPIINRFLILNLKQTDYDFNEIFTKTFDNISSNDEIKDYLGIGELDGPYWSFARIATFLKTLVSNKRIIEVQNSASTGLVGFTSVRSVDHSLKYLNMFCKMYGTDDWVQIVGDSLGILGQEKISVFTRLQSALKSGKLVNKSESNEEKQPSTIAEITKEIERRHDSGLPYDGWLSVIDTLVKNVESISSEDLEALSKSKVLELMKIYSQVLQNLVSLS